MSIESTAIGSSRFKYFPLKYYTLSTVEESLRITTYTFLHITDLANFNTQLFTAEFCTFIYVKRFIALSKAVFMG